jgi:hypothetical protein
MQVENREAAQAAEDASRTLYGMEGPRRRPRPEERVAVPSDAEGAQLGPVVARSTVRDRWREESRDHALERNREQEGSGIEERFAALRVDMETELGRRTDAAVARLQATFEQEIEALRTANREEAKRFRSANGEAFVRIRASGRSTRGSSGCASSSKGSSNGCGARTTSSSSGSARPARTGSPRSTTC